MVESPSRNCVADPCIVVCGARIVALALRTSIMDIPGQWLLHDITSDVAKFEVWFIFNPCREVSLSTTSDLTSWLILTSTPLTYHSTCTICIARAHLLNVDVFNLTDYIYVHFSDAGNIMASTISLILTDARPPSTHFSAAPAPVSRQGGFHCYP